MVRQSKSKRELFYWLTISNFLYIVILVILAGVAISLTLGNNGLFNKAKEKYLNAQNYEEEQFAKSADEIYKYVNGNRDTVTISADDWKEVQDKLNQLDTLKASNNIKTYTSITQLGLTEYTTVVDIIDAMPNNSIISFLI